MSTIPRALVGETNVEEFETLVSFYGKGRDELDLAFNFIFINAPFEADALRSVVETTEASLPPGAWPVWTGSNHDVSRLATRWAGGDEAKIRAALLMLLTLRGTPFLYQGDEIGLVDTVLTQADLRDPVGLRYWPAYAGRDPVRTPMPWRDVPGGGFTSASATPWLPIGDAHARNVEAQRKDAASVLSLTHDLVALRRSSPDLQLGDYATMPAPTGVWAWRRGETTVVLLNLSDEPSALTGLSGQIAISTDRTRDGEHVTNPLALQPWEGLVVIS
jgi:alpha-glucosidase